MFIFLMLVMILLATTELGTDSWIAALMTPRAEGLRQQRRQLGAHLHFHDHVRAALLRRARSCIASRRSALLARVLGRLPAAGLFWLSHAGAVPIMVFLAATCYGIGKCFFWPTTLGVVSEQFPKGGALTLSAIAGVGVISVGVLGNPLLGTIQDHSWTRCWPRKTPRCTPKSPIRQQSKFGLTYQPLDQTKIASSARQRTGRSGKDLRTTNNQSHAGQESPSCPRSCFSATSA